MKNGCRYCAALSPAIAGMGFIGLVDYGSMSLQAAIVALLALGVVVTAWVALARFAEGERYRHVHSKRRRARGPASQASVG